MYKLKIIDGIDKGHTHVLNPGKFTIGRVAGNDIVLPSVRVSKQHCVIYVENSAMRARDLGSSNGTFVNGMLIREKELQIGDRLSIGETIFEVLFSAEKKKLPLKKKDTDVFALPEAIDAPVQDFYAPAPPKTLKEKMVFFFNEKIMPPFYTMNTKYELQVMGVGMLGFFLILNLLFSVTPLVDANRKSILQETARRASFMAHQIVEMNSQFLAAHNETKAEIGSVESAEGVMTAVLIDLDSRIIAPATKLNSYLSSGAEATIAVRARDAFRKGRETGFTSIQDDDLVVAVEPVKVLNPAVGRNVIVAMAIVSIDSSLAIPGFGEVGVMYSEVLILTALIAFIIFFVLYKLFLRPLEILTEDMDRALKGELSQVTHEYLFTETNSLWDMINAALIRIPKTSSMGGGFESQDNRRAYAEELVPALRFLGDIGGVVLCDADRKLLFINSLFEEISGIRSEGSLGMEIQDVARDQALGAFVRDLFDRVQNGGESQKEDFDFSGISYAVYVSGFGASMGSARCYMMLAVRQSDESG